MEIERTAIWPCSRIQLTYQTKAVGDRVLQSGFWYLQNDESFGKQGVAANSVLSKHLPDRKHKGPTNLVVVAHSGIGQVLELVLMDDDHSLILGLASQRCSHIMKERMHVPGFDIVGCTLRVQNQHWIWGEPSYCDGTIAKGIMLIQEFQWGFVPEKEIQKREGKYVSFQTDQVNLVLTHGLVVFNAPEGVSERLGPGNGKYRPMTLQSILNGLFVMDPETRQRWIITVGQRQIASTNMLETDAQCFGCGSSYQPCIAYQFPLDKFEQEMELNFDIGDEEYSNYNDLRGEGKLICAKRWYRSHFFAQKGATLCPTLESVLESCYCDVQFD